MRAAVDKSDLRPIERRRPLRLWTYIVVAALAPVLVSAQPRYPDWAGQPANVAAPHDVPPADGPLGVAPAPPQPRPQPVGPGHPYHPRYGRWWPGQVLPPDAPATIVTDPARYHVRPAPPGYVWLLCDGDLLLAATASGLITEVLPGGGD
jgi:hypothetical protein